MRCKICDWSPDPYLGQSDYWYGLGARRVHTYDHEKKEWTCDGLDPVGPHYIDEYYNSLSIEEVGSMEVGDFSDEE